MTDGHNCDLMPIKSLINNKYFSNVYRFVKDHRIIYYVLFFVLSAYVFTSYEQPFRVWYDHNIMPVFEWFVPNWLSFLTVAILLIIVANNLYHKVTDRYLYDGRVICVLGVVSFLLIWYRLSGLYNYVSWFGCVSYVDVIILVCLAHIVAFIYGRCWLLWHTKSNNERSNTYSMIIHDWPICDSSGDIMAFSEDAKKVATEIKDLDSNFTWSLAITGQWGIGKTSFLNMVVKELDNDEFEVLSFNPRDSKSCGNIQEDFFSRLSCVLAKYDGCCNGTIKKYMASLQLIDNRRLFERLTNFYKIWNKDGLKGTVEKSFKALSKRILVLIDDFDRLSKDEIEEVLKLIDNNAAFSNLVFLTAYDKEQVNKIFGDTYKTPDACFVDKFFNLEYSIPIRPYSYLSKYLEDSLVSQIHASVDEEEEIRYSVNGNIKLYKKCLPTLRDIKRYVNQVVIDYSNVRGEVNVNEYLLLHLIKYKYPEKYKALYQFQYIETGMAYGHPSIIYLKKDVTEKLDIYPILTRLFLDSERAIGESYRHIFEVKSFDCYFVNQMFGALRIIEMAELFYEEFDDACRKIDQWIVDDDKRNDLYEYLSNYRMTKLGSSEEFSRYVDIIAYFASKVPEPRAYWLFSVIINKKNIDDYYCSKYRTDSESLKNSILSIITDDSNKPDYVLLQSLHADYRIHDNGAEYLIDDDDIWPRLKSAFVYKIKNESVGESMMAMLYKCIDHMELQSRRVVLDKECLTVIREKIEGDPSYYIKHFVRLGAVSSSPNYNSIVCEPFCVQIWGNYENVENFIKDCKRKGIDGSVLSYNFWRIYEHNDYKPIEFDNQGDVQSKIDNNMSDEVVELESLLKLQSKVDQIPVDVVSENSKVKIEYKNRLLALKKEIEEIHLYIKLNGSVRSAIDDRLKLLES